jgi:hypothetical protein
MPPLLFFLYDLRLANQGVALGEVAGVAEAEGVGVGFSIAFT